VVEWCWVWITGSDDGSVRFEPNRSGNQEYRLEIFATNLDLYIQEWFEALGQPGPKLTMPSLARITFSPSKQIADVIAYLIKLNP